jgi:hypothetical protein
MLQYHPDNITSTVDVTFSISLNQLALKDLHLENEAKVDASTALVASTNSSCCGSNYCSSSWSTAQQQQHQ